MVETKWSRASEGSAISVTAEDFEGSNALSGGGAEDFLGVDD